MPPVLEVTAVPIVADVEIRNADERGLLRVCIRVLRVEEFERNVRDESTASHPRSERPFENEVLTLVRILDPDLLEIERPLQVLFTETGSEGDFRIIIRPDVHER